MISLIAVPDDDPLFSLSSSSVFLQEFYKKFKVLLDMIGVDSEKYGTHSFRRGAATLAFKARAPADLIKTQGDWKCDAYQKYIKVSLNDK